LAFSSRSVVAEISKNKIVSVNHRHSAGVRLEDGSACEAEELGLGEELFDGLVVFPELRAVALVEDEDDAFVLQQGLRGGEDIGSDDLVEQAGELGVGEADAVQGFEFLAEIGFQRGAVGDVWAVFVFELLERADEAVFDGVFPDDGAGEVRRIVVGNIWGHHRWQQSAAIGDGRPRGLWLNGGKSARQRDAQESEGAWKAWKCRVISGRLERRKCTGADPAGRRRWFAA
jgi:hypothetical protein